MLYQKLAAIVIVVIVAASAIGWRRYQANIAPPPQARILQTPFVASTSITPAPHAIIGRWIAPRVPTRIGPVKIELVLRADGSCHLNVWTCGPLTARLKDVNGTYAIRGGRLCSRLLKSGSCPFLLHDGNLLVQYKPGQIVIFHREIVAAANGLDQPLASAHLA